MSYDSFDRLDDAISEIKNEPSITGPETAVINQTLQRIHEIDQPARSIFRPIYAVAASAILAFGSIALICLLALPAKTELTWGDVIATINQAHTMSCRMVIRVKMRLVIGGKLPPKPSSVRTDIGKIMIKSPGLRREEQPGSIIIINWLARKRLTLDTNEKLAVISELTGTMPQDTSTIQTFDDLKNLKDAQPLGQRNVNGEVQVGFHFHRDSQSSGMMVHDPDADETHYVNDIWADAKTHRIVQCIIDTRVMDFDPSDMNPKTHKLEKCQMDEIHLVMDEMQWNVALDDSLFSVTPPPGYKIVVPDPDN